MHNDPSPVILSVAKKICIRLRGGYLLLMTSMINVQNTIIMPSTCFICHLSFVSPAQSDGLHDQQEIGEY